MVASGASLYTNAFFIYFRIRISFILIKNHLHSFEHVELQIVVTEPDSQLLNFLSVSRLVAVLHETDDCGVICKLQEFDSEVFRGAVICVEREKQWGAWAYVQKIVRRQRDCYLDVLTALRGVQ